MINVIRNNIDNTVNHASIVIPLEFTLTDRNSYTKKFVRLGAINYIGNQIGTGHYIDEHYFKKENKIIYNENCWNITNCELFESGLCLNIIYMLLNQIIE